MSKPENAKSWCFPDDAIGFLSALKANNNREWFNANKARYQSAIKDTAATFCTLMEAELEKLTATRFSSKIFRIHRDVRFSKDKTPYNTHLHISFSPDQKSGANGAYMFGLDTEKISSGLGVFAFDKSVLDVYRTKIAGSEGEKLQGVMNKLTRAGAVMSEPELKRVPAGFDPGHPRAELLRRKGLAAWISRDEPQVATKPGIAMQVAKDFKTVKPLMDWL